MDELGRKERAYPSDWENGATIDLGAIVHNYRTLEAHCGVPVTCVLKANAYGHGLGAV